MKPGQSLHQANRALDAMEPSEANVTLQDTYNLAALAQDCSNKTLIKPETSEPQKLVAIHTVRTQPLGKEFCISSLNGFVQNDLKPSGRDSGQRASQVYYYLLPPTTPSLELGCSDSVSGPSLAVCFCV